MDPVRFVSFLTVTLAFVATPGPSVAFASAQAVRFGPRAALVGVAGEALGTVVHIIIAVASLQTLIALSGVILPWLQIAGGLFILCLGWRALTAPPAENMEVAHRTTFFAGFFACVTNPKAIVFFVALFPGFISPDHPMLLQTLVYGAIFVVLDALSIIAYALLAMHSFRRAARRLLSVETLSGLGLMGVGGLLILKGWRALPRTD